MKTKLSSREQKVLRATIDRYIATAEPVGSKILVEEYKFDISSATVRNVMGMLERSGLLYQPHTSAGRIPSDSGYRVYVDELINLPNLFASPLNQNASQLLTQKLERSGSHSLEALLRSVAQILATLSGCIALITAPVMQVHKIRHVQLMMVEERKVMLIAVSDTYHTASVLMEIPSETKVSDLELELPMLNNFLNAHLRDRSLANLANLQWDTLDREFQHYASFLEQLLQQLTQAYPPPVLGQIVISGITELLRQPEFTQLSQVQAIIQLLEEDQALLLPLIFNSPESTSAQNIEVKIGSEITLESIQNCTLISSAYSCAQVPVGSVGVLGPTRLGYERAIASVKATATHLSELITQRPLLN